MTHDMAHLEMDITDSLSFEQRLGLILHREQAVRETRKNTNLIITAPSEVGRSCRACAFAWKACREGHSGLYFPNEQTF